MDSVDITKTPYMDTSYVPEAVVGTVPPEQTLQYPPTQYPPPYTQQPPQQQQQHPQQYPMRHPTEYPGPEDTVNTSHGVHVTSYQFPAPNSDTETLVSQEPPPNTCLVGALLATFLCFWPTGIVAIVYAAEARSAFARGDYLRGHVKARRARTLVIASVITGSVIIIAIVVFVVILALLGTKFY